MNLISTTRAIGEHFIDGKSSYLCRARGSGQTPAYALHFSRHSACKTKARLDEQDPTRNGQPKSSPQHTHMHAEDNERVPTPSRAEVRKLPPIQQPSPLGPDVREMSDSLQAERIEA
ncbi:hypothetical protein GLOTRDRAFT_128970 [Gloeophyllum trabeum ATCC 11539]|uniref:Uncharacterized protein n=1 Tax=Gloeophyllum trabeum (strain ATCC 11539 / FP-39264 / Madison 617) TaxID=670483 RepID=S7Q8I3_GLOTA|nr:uncharacterized protein GLOTRDRAFT_128970 [Gloeophyllum trabeum ATCC 11539]EPQ55753.1 hypothetical protein GLOTRDRAFT_128970 [Gloeophyllum trabeum ATCC 11539]